MHKLYLDTVGCQMNVLDSEMVVASLRRQGYSVVRTIDEADTILFNTCSIREQAENKTYSALGRLKGIKKQHPEKIIGVMGCMAQKDQKLVFDRAPYVDLVVGPGQLKEIPGLIERLRAGEGKQLMAVGLGRRDASLEEIKRTHETFDPLRDPTMRPTPSQAYLRIQIGCDKFCTYCVVPNTRGPEQGRLPSHILSEARTLAEQGCIEITLIGQTVNSYRATEDGKTWRLADLLVALHAIPELRRLKFVTNYPKDMTNDLLSVVRDYEKVSPYLHVPAQSGSNEVLKRMKRGYTVEDYREMMSRIREHLPNGSISSDFIVGFCGETDEDFEKTCELVRECRFKNSFIFKYSERPGTKAETLFPDDIPFDVKQWRNNELLAIQNAISEELNTALLGRTMEVLVEGASKRADHEADSEIAAAPKQLMGRTHCDRIVVFEGDDSIVGKVVPVAIVDTSPHTLFGTLVESSAEAPALVPLAIV